MNPTDVVLEEVRGFLSLDKTDTTFDNEILPHVNGAIVKVSQNGACKSVFITTTTTWSDLAIGDVDAKYFTMIPLYLMLSTKMLFDPPPPSTLQYYQTSLTELLWRIKIEVELNEAKGGN